MTNAKVCSECITCILDKYLKRYPSQASEEQKLQYMKSVLSLLSQVSGNVSAPEAVAMITQIQKDLFGIKDDFCEEKQRFNDLMLEIAPRLKHQITEADDPFYMAVCYALVGNYIDFGAIKSVDEESLFSMLGEAHNLNFDIDEYRRLKADVLSSKRMVYLTDNCGEIVADKLLISVIKEINPDTDITVIVRGAPVLNDATLDDAVRVGLDEVAKVISNGTPVAGTALAMVCDEAKEAIDSADVIISKGQGNFETLWGCGKNVYYLFLCKCELFAERFGVKKFTEMLMNDLRFLK